MARPLREEPLVKLQGPHDVMLRPLFYYTKQAGSPVARLPACLLYGPATRKGLFSGMQAPAERPPPSVRRTLKTRQARQHPYYQNHHLSRKSGSCQEPRRLPRPRMRSIAGRPALRTFLVPEVDYHTEVDVGDVESEAHLRRDTRPDLLTGHIALRNLIVLNTPQTE